MLAKVSRLWTDHAGRFIRYGGVSVFNVLFGQSLLAWFIVIGMHAALANLAAVAIGTVPAYLLARRYVWKKSGRHSIRREVLPFWVLNFVGLLLSTASTSLAHELWGSKVLVISAASLLAWFAVWVAKYVLLDRAIFKVDANETAGPLAA